MVPGKKETGTKTAMSTSEVATTALVTSPIAAEVAWCGSLSPSEMWRWTFSMTTMASSTTRPVARVMPNRVSELMEKPKTLDEGEGSDERNGDGDGGDEGSAPVLQEKEDDGDDDDNGFDEGLDDLMNGGADDGGGIEGDDGVHARRERFASRLIRLWRHGRPGGHPRC